MGGSSLRKVPEPRPVHWSQLFLNAYGSHEYRFEVGLPAKELVRRLKEDTASPMAVSLFTGKSFRGSVKEESFKLTWVNRLYNNSWAPTARGKVESFGDRTRITIKFDVSPFVQIFMVIWMCFATLAAIVCFGAALTKGGEPGLLLPALLPVFGVVLLGVGTALGKRDQRSVLGYFAGLPDTTFLSEHKLIE